MGWPLDKEEDCGDDDDDDDAATTTATAGATVADAATHFGGRPLPRFAAGVVLTAAEAATAAAPVLALVIILVLFPSAKCSLSCSRSLLAGCSINSSCWPFSPASRRGLFFS